MPSNTWLSTETEYFLWRNGSRVHRFSAGFLVRESRIPAQAPLVLKAATTCRSRMEFCLHGLFSLILLGAVAAFDRFDCQVRRRSQLLLLKLIVRLWAGSHFNRVPPRLLWDGKRMPQNSWSLSRLVQKLGRSKDETHTSALCLSRLRFVPFIALPSTLKADALCVRILAELGKVVRCEVIHDNY